MTKYVVLSLALGFLLTTGSVFADAQTVIYVTNNNNNSNYLPAQSGTMCSEAGGFCTNGVFIMGSRRTYYAPTRSKLKSSRQQRLGLNTPTGYNDIY